MSVHNAYFYLDFAVFKVEDELFRIPTYYLKAKSAIFNKMFELPPGQEKPVEGLSDENPIHLEGVRKVDFQRFLEVILRLQVDAPTGVPYQSDCWLSTLTLANLWGFSDLRNMAILKLSRDYTRLWSCVDLILMGRLYEVHEWTRKGYIALVDREDKVSEAEAERLGWKTALKVCGLREDKLRANTPNPTKAIWGLDTADQVDTAFADELKTIRDAGSALNVPPPTVVSSPGPSPLLANAATPLFFIRRG